MKYLFLVISILFASNFAFAASPKKPKTSSSINMAVLNELSHDLSLTPAFLVGVISLGESHGLSSNEIVSGLHDFGSSIYEAKNGRDLEAAAAMSQLNLTYPEQRQDGSPDMDSAVLALANVVKKQSNPYTQERIAEIFGATNILPILRDGPETIKAAKVLAASTLP